MNLHRRGKTGCPHVTENFSSCCTGESYSFQIIEVLSGNVHDENGILDENICRLRIDSEFFWMKTLKNNFSYFLAD